MKRRAALVLAVVFAFAAVAAIAFAGQTRATGPSSVLAVFAGQVELAHGAAAYASASDGELVSAGDRIRTDATGRAVVTFFDGSTVEIAPATELTIEAAAMRDGAVDLVIGQAIGRTFSSVHKLIDPRSRYEIRTPSLTAAVRGTKFEVTVAADGSAAERTTEGLVAVRSAGAEVLVPAGAETNARPGTPPSPPAPIAPPAATPTGASGTPAITSGTPVATEAPILSPPPASSAAPSAAIAPPSTETAPSISFTAGPALTTEVPSFGPLSPAPVATLAPLGPLPSPTLVPLLIESPAPLPTATVVPLPTASIAPLPTASIAPLPTASIAPLPTASIAPLPTASIAPLTSPSPSIGLPITTLP